MKEILMILFTFVPGYGSDWSRRCKHSSVRHKLARPSSLLFHRHPGRLRALWLCRPAGSERPLCAPAPIFHLWPWSHSQLCRQDDDRLRWQDPRLAVGHPQLADGDCAERRDSALAHAALCYAKQDHSGDNGRSNRNVCFERANNWWFASQGEKGRSLGEAARGASLPF